MLLLFFCCCFVLGHTHILSGLGVYSCVGCYQPLNLFLLKYLTSLKYSKVKEEILLDSILLTTTFPNNHSLAFYKEEK